MTPTFHSKEKLIFVGPRAFFAYDNVQAIGGMWEKFGALYDSIGNKASPVCFGLSLISDRPKEGFDYMCAVRVTSTEGLPEGASVFEAPAQDYASFAHQGHVMTLHQTCRYILDDWAPTASPAVNVDPCSLIEVYSENFDPAKEGGIDVWIPLKGK